MGQTLANTNGNYITTNDGRYTNVYKAVIDRQQPTPMAIDPLVTAWSLQEIARINTHWPPMNSHGTHRVKL